MATARCIPARPPSCGPRSPRSATRSNASRSGFILLALSPGSEAIDLFAVGLAALGLVLFAAIAALSHERDRPFSASMVYLVFGLLASVALGELSVARLNPLADEIVLQRIAELALPVAVFAAGMCVERSVGRGSWIAVAVLLALVMPLTIAAVALFATQVMGLSLAAGILLGAVLAPTDPVLAGSVGLTPPGGECHGEPRFSLHTEAALNDGLASPFVLLGLFVAQQGGTAWLVEWALVDVLYGAGVGAVGGLLAGRGIAAATLLLRRRGWLSHEFDGFVALAAVLLVYGATQAIGAYGLVAAFAAGYAFRSHEYDHEANRRVHDGADSVKLFLELAVILLLGSMVTVAGLARPGVAGWLLAPLIIVVIRPALVIAFVGRGLMGVRERVFLGLFGVRGVAALFYAALVVHSAALSADETAAVFWTTAAVVMVSIVVHGIAATPATRRLTAKR